MKQRSPQELRGLAIDLENELARMQHLADDIGQVRVEIDEDPQHARLFYENLALKLHNFYTGCERIFNLIIAELNGAPLSGFDWHQRLLDRMTSTWDDRPPMLSHETAHQLREYLGFRHVVRNVYGYELDTERVERLVDRYPFVWHRFQEDVARFLHWLRSLADQLDGD